MELDRNNLSPSRWHGQCVRLKELQKQQKKTLSSKASGARSSFAWITEHMNGSNVRREKRLSRCVLVPLLAVHMHYAWRLKELLTFAGGLTAWPGAVGEADPFCRAVERVTRGASEAHFSVLLKAALLSGGMGRRARIPAGAPFITCTDKCTYILDTILHTSSSFFQLSEHMYFSTWTETNCMFLLKKKKRKKVDSKLLEVCATHGRLKLQTWSICKTWYTVSQPLLQHKLKAGGSYITLKLFISP